MDIVAILKAIGQALLDYFGAWLQKLWDFAQAVINEFGLWSATPIVIILVLVAMSFLPVVGKFPKWLLGSVVGNAAYYSRLLIVNVFAIWVFLIFLVYPPLGQFARWQSTINLEAKEALMLLLGLIGEGFVCFLAARRQWRRATDIDTPVEVLKFESRTTGIVAVILTYISGWLIARHYMPWGLYVPWLFSVYSAWEIWDRTVNTAAMKPVMQTQRTA